MGSHRSARAGYLNSGGITPMIVVGLRLRTRVRPMIPGSPPKRRCHRPWLITAVRATPAWLSCGVSVRPSLALAPRTSKKLPDTNRPVTSRGSSPARMNGPLIVAMSASASNLRLWACHCR